MGLLKLGVLALVVGGLFTWYPTSDLRIETAFHTMDRRMHSNADGYNTHTMEFDVPKDASRLDVGACYHLKGRATMTLTDPHGRQWIERIEGDNRFCDGDWKRVEDPMAGPWTFEIKRDATGRYTFGAEWCRCA